MLTTALTLLERLRQPNQREAWERFNKLYTPLLVAWAKRQGFQAADAADLTQEVLIKLTLLLPTYERGPGQSFRGWLSRLTANQCKDFRRRRATRPLPGADGLSGIDNPTPDSDWDELDYRRSLACRAMELIKADFSPKTWAAFTSVMLDGCTAAETAAKLTMSENAVYMARNRVLTRLRQELDGLLD